MTFKLLQRISDRSTMNGLSIAGIIIRFLFGGIAVAISSVIAKKMGGKIGGIFATFPAVYLAALLTVRLDYTGSELLGRSLTLSAYALFASALPGSWMQKPLIGSQLAFASGVKPLLSIHS